MGDHDALGARGRAAGVVDRQQVVFVYLRSDEVGRRGGDLVLVIDPAVARALQGDELARFGDAVADAVYGVEVVAVNADDAGAAVVDNVGEVVGGEAVVDGDEDRAELRDRVEGFELGMGVGRDVGDAIAFAHAHALQRRGPAVAAVAELLVGEAQIAVDDGLAASVEFAGAAHEIQRGQWGFHLAASSSVTICAQLWRGFGISQIEVERRLDATAMFPVAAGVVGTVLPRREDTMKTVISKDGTRIAYDQSGQGPALMLVSGASATRADEASRRRGPCSLFHRVCLRPARSWRQRRHKAICGGARSGRPGIADR